MIKLVMIILIVHVLRSLNQNYLGFIYPYVVFYHNSEGENQELQFIRLDKIIHSEQILSENEEVKTPSSYLKESYQMFNESRKIPFNNIDIQSIKIKDNCILISDKGYTKYKIFTQNYHLYLFHKQNPNAYNPYEIHLEKNFMVPRDVNSADQEKFLFDIEQYKQGFMKIAIFQNITHFYFNLEFEQNQMLGQTNVIQYCFVKKYSIKDEIKQLLIVKNSNKEIINAVIISSTEILVFTIKEQSHKFILDFYVLQEYPPPYKIQYLSVDHILHVYKGVYINPINNMTQLSNRKKPFFNLLISNISNNSMNCNIIKQQLYYYTIINKMVIACSDTTCGIYDRYCRRNQTIQLSQFRENSSQVMQIQKIELIRFPIDKVLLKYISYLKFEFKNNKTFNIRFCHNERIVEESKIKIDNDTKNYVCESNPKITFLQTERCQKLSLGACVQLQQCFWNSSLGQCEIKTNQVKKLFKSQVYNVKSTFLQYYSQYEYGRDLTFLNTSKCEEHSNQITTIIQIPNQIDKQCYYYRELGTYNQFRINWVNQAIGTTEIGICQNILNDHYQLNCYADRFLIDQPLDVYINVKYYVLIYFKVKNKKNQNAPGLIEISLTNTELQNFAKATKIMSIIFITFFSVILFSVAVKLLHKKIKLICIYYGCLKYIPSDKYPLEFLELQLLTKQYKKKKYIKQYKFQAQIENSKFQPDQSNIHECSFCLSELLNNQKIFELYCKHKYHKACLSDWLRSDRNSNKCPICKRGLNQSEYNLFQGNQRVNSNSQMI